MWLDTKWMEEAHGMESASTRLGTPGIGSENPVSSENPARNTDILNTCRSFKQRCALRTTTVPPNGPPCNWCPLRRLLCPVNLLTPSRISDGTGAHWLLPCLVEMWNLHSLTGDEVIVMGAWDLCTASCRYRYATVCNKVSNCPCESPSTFQMSEFKM